MYGTNHRAGSKLKTKHLIIFIFTKNPGSIVTCIAFSLSIFSVNVPMLMVLYGVIGGFGVGLIYLPAVVAVGYYFESKRALATGNTPNPD